MILVEIVAMCPYPKDPEPNGSDWEEYGKAVCDLLLEKGLIKKE